MRKSAFQTILLAGILSAFLISGQTASADPNLVSRWTFDEGSGTTAYDSAGSNNGTLVNGPVWTAGQINGALSFDGSNDYVDCGNNTSLVMGTSLWTAAAWFKISDRTQYKGILSTWNGGGSSDNYRIVVYDDPSVWGAQDKVSFMIYDGGPRYKAIGTTTVTDDKWHHVAGIRDATHVRIYVDGVEESNMAAVRSRYISNSSNLVIGRGTSGGWNFKGTIDDVRIYNRALSAGEVWQLYQNGLGNSPVIELSATQFQFRAIEGGSNPSGQILGISNSGAETLNWEINESCGWLSVEPNSGSSTGEVDDVNLSVDISGLTAGLYTCNLTISDANASNNPQIVNITLRVRNDGTLHVPSEYSTIQAAINDCDNGYVVIVAPGTYTGAGNRDLDFGGKAITVRSKNGPGGCTIDCESVSGHRGFYFHSGEDGNSIVSGFTIANGRASGGGIYCSGSSPRIENCIITSNSHYATGPLVGRGYDAYGGGIYCGSNSNPIITGCTISNNIAKGGQGGDEIFYHDPPEVIPAGGGGDGYGGGIYSSSDSSPTIVCCNLANNEATGGNPGQAELSYPSGGNSHGGGIYGYGNISVSNCVINNNSAIGGNGIDGFVADRGAGFGGGVDGNGTIKNCLIKANEVHDGSSGGPPSVISTGGGIKTNSANISNCTITENVITYNDGAGICGSGSTVIVNCIIWNNDYDDLSGCSAIYSCISDADSGTGVIHNDPCFVTGPGGDYYLSQIAAEQAVDSPCVNAGSDTAVNLGMDIFTTRMDEVDDAGIVDMGYHYPMNIADLNKDGDIDLADFAILASQWLQAPGEPSADIAPPGGDGIVDMWDLGVLADNWLISF